MGVAEEQPSTAKHATGLQRGEHAVLDQLAVPAGVGQDGLRR